MKIIPAHRVSMEESTHISAKRGNTESASKRHGLSTPKPILLLVIPLVLGLSLSFAQVYVLAILPADGKHHGDFVLPYAAALLALDGTPEQAYDIVTIHEIEKQVSGDSAMDVIPWPYPPFFQLLVMPLGCLDYITAYRVYLLLTLSMLTIVAWCIAPYWQMPLLLLIFPAVAFCAVAGQNGNLSAALVGAGLLLLKRRPIASGVAFGLMAYKPHLAVAIPFCLLAGRHYRALAATALTAIATVLISVVAFGSKPLIAFSLNLTSHAGMAFDYRPLWQRMPTVLILMLQLTGSQVHAWIAQSLVAGAALVGVVWIWRRSPHEGWKALALAASLPLITPYYLDYDMAIFVIPFAFLVGEVWTTGFTYNRALIIATLWLTPPVIFLLPHLLPKYWQIGPIMWASLFGYVVYRVARDGFCQFQKLPII
jgi:hypothetical protein